MYYDDQGNLHKDHHQDIVEIDESIEGAEVVNPLIQQRDDSLKDSEELGELEPNLNEGASEPSAEESIQNILCERDGNHDHDKHDQVEEVDERKKRKNDEHESKLVENPM